MRENITVDSFEGFVLTQRSMTGIGLAIIAWAVQNPVSYTHLDVYKRQVLVPVKDLPGYIFP